MPTKRKVKSLHTITFDGCAISTRISYTPTTDHVGVTTTRHYSTKDCQKQYYEDNIDHINQYREENSEAIAAYNKQYYVTNRDRVRDRAKQYYDINRDHVKQYYEANREAIAARMKQYQRDHPREVRTYVTPSGSCAHLNDWFEGCRRHHVDANTIIHIPTQMHLANRHNICSGLGMNVINALAFEFLFSSST